ncbi:MAG: hypothetical protein HOQ20_10710 [Bradyrhizobium sp.]|nr:hypothetical protein [Bradyrhizobium sp.]
MAQLWHGIDSLALLAPKTSALLQNLRQKSHSWGLAAREKGFSAGIVADFDDNGD